MATWQTPKTDWVSSDYFNAADYNRIKNNLIYLRDYAVKLYEKEFSIGTVSEDKTYSDFFYAEEINQMETNLVTITSNSVKTSYGTAPTYAANGKVMDYVELNRLESAILDVYSRLTNVENGRRMFEWNFGFEGGEL